MKIRLKFRKEGQVKFVGHLDTMRLFQRAVKVACIPVAYSQGFSPHSLIYFALPLAVGMSSTGDYMDIVTKEAIEPSEVKAALNKVLVKGIEILEAFEVEEKGDSLMSLVTAADYQIIIEDSTKAGITLELLRQKFENEETLMVMKKGKKGIKEVDIKPLILSLEMAETAGEICLETKVYAGSERNLNPDLLMKALLGEETANALTFKMTRKEMYTGEAASSVPLYTFGHKA